MFKDGGYVLEQCEVPSQHVADWVSGGIVLCIYCV